MYRCVCVFTRGEKANKTKSADTDEDLNKIDAVPAADTAAQKPTGDKAKKTKNKFKCESLYIIYSY